ncbi:MAG: MFS transporter, partial [Gammaproteobacteria bacterium]|nr:MFS transporter [Gammaproteobacteria bacterium]
RLFFLAALSGLVRWTGLSVSTDLPVLIGLQLLHAGTFALTHLAVFEFISQRIPPQLTASAQTLYDIVSAAVVFALAMMLAGALYEYRGGQAFLAMTGFSLAAMLLLLIGTPKLLSDR